LFPLRRKDKQKILNNQEKREKNQAALFIDGSGAESTSKCKTVANL
jgi:hypothetical protein